MFLVHFFICCLCVSSSFAASAAGRNNDTESNCGELDCMSVSKDCKKKCGCDNTSLYYFNATTNACELNYEYLSQVILEKFNTQEKIRSSAEKVFGGIVVCVILFITCASICVFSACYYCCRIHYKDNKLRGDVNALANKLNREGKLQKPKKIPTAPKAESCNVMVEDAGVFVC